MAELIIKLFELRDEGTQIHAMAIKVVAQEHLTSEDFILRYAGWGFSQVGIYLTTLHEPKTQYNSSKWNDGGRTMRATHDYIKKNWGRLKSGDVVDVEYISGDSREPKKASWIEEAGADY